MASSSAQVKLNNTQQQPSHQLAFQPVFSQSDPTFAAFQVPSIPYDSMRLQDEHIKDVWIDNLFTELDNIARLIQTYNYVAMDTEYPGTVYLPSEVNNQLTIYINLENKMHDIFGNEFEYQMVKVNVDNLKLIQVGITLSDANGAVPIGVCSWQFNLHYDISQELYAKESMDLLKRSGFDFDKHKSKGIPHEKFAEYLITSGLFLNPEVHWITFHGGVDFGYMLKVVLNTEIPNLGEFICLILNDEANFFEMMNIYFCNFYDIKEIKRDIDYLTGGLSKIAKELDIERIGTMHQAGSDSLVTCKVFFKLKELFKKWWPNEDSPSIEQRFQGIIYGLGQSANEDIYIEEYRSLANEYSNTQGKLINLNMIGQGGQSLVAGTVAHQFDLISNASTTISACSSINSLTGLQQNPMVINQQHYLLMQQQQQHQQLAKQQIDEDYSHFYRGNLPTAHAAHLELMQQKQAAAPSFFSQGGLYNGAPPFVPTIHQY